jgi:beta-glucanase (GH16 family)
MEPAEFTRATWNSRRFVNTPAGELMAAAMRALLAVLLTAGAARPPPGYEPIAELSDEFDGTALDRTKWSTDRAVVGWAGRRPGLFDPANVAVRDGALQLWARPARRNASWPEGFDNYTTAAVHSLARVREGYFEVRWRSGGSGVSSSWWLHQRAGGAWTEVDVFETTGATNGAAANASNLPSHVHVFELPNTSSAELPGRCHCKLYHSRSGQARCSVGSTVDPLAAGETFSSGFHVAGLNWTASGVTISIDGHVVNRVSSPCLVQEIGMDFDRETMPGWMALPDPATLPDQPFEIDYVRAWRRIAPRDS